MKRKGLHWIKPFQSLLNSPLSWVILLYTRYIYQDIILTLYVIRLYVRHQFALYSAQWLTPVQVMTSGVWMLRLHNCYHTFYSATEHRQIWHHDWTTVHFFQPLWRRSQPSTMPQVRFSDRHSWGRPPSNPVLEVVKSLWNNHFCADDCGKTHDAIFLLKYFQFPLCVSEIRLPGWIALKILHQCLWP